MVASLAISRARVLDLGVVANTTKKGIVENLGKMEGVGRVT